MFTKLAVYEAEMGASHFEAKGQSSRSRRTTYTGKNTLWTQAYSRLLDVSRQVIEFQVLKYRLVKTNFKNQSAKNSNLKSVNSLKNS